MHHLSTRNFKETTYTVSSSLFPKNLVSKKLNNETL